MHFSQGHKMGYFGDGLKFSNAKPLRLTPNLKERYK